MRSFSPIEALSALAVGFQAALTLAAIRAPADLRIPMHFGMDGEPDRYGGRTETILFLLFMTIGCAAVVITLGVMARRAADSPARRRGLALGQLAAALCLAIPSFIIGAPLLGIVQDAGGRLLWLYLLLAILGAVIGKMPPNAIIGVRTPWSLASRAAWDSSNRLAGWLFLLIGATGAISVLLAAPIPPQIFLTAILAAAALTILDSWRVWRNDPERRK